MITLYLYPPLFGLPDNNPFGLKVDTYLRKARIPYTIHSTVDTSSVPRNQLPCLDHDGTVVSDSNRMIDYLDRQFAIGMDKSLSTSQALTAFLLGRTFDSSLYWCMSYSRWQDPEFWPQFKAAFLAANPTLDPSVLDNARKYNMDRYRMQGIGRYPSHEVYQQGIENLHAASALLGDQPYMLGTRFHVIDACCYGFMANIFYFDIDTPMKKVFTERPNLAQYVTRIRAELGY